MSHTKSEKAKLMNRIRRVRGQIEAVERAIEGEEGCARSSTSSGRPRRDERAHDRSHRGPHPAARGRPTKDAELKRGADELIEAVQSYLR